ncbi:ragulator complex protein LAMTOR4 homolog [Thrips palmi]|uniref:Late endosomal/lysosomal adaptor and MAPK and MTOR activator 4 n=1 Tax=Thrips palmi TaxID=161013 RepID=A0A6P8YN36_THRPL|nr:ragulator complex protein LAMTOR4 homolog [Thrips palmi]XP_034238599.1 ragulator complex protein LAMTOR4 homolog [Thrips palmi]XP_034238600.1 ragulator complex protein LAMTOR4 homolog [Thrips palmi]
MLSVDRIPDQVGYLVMTEDGAVVSSGGELENGERIANVVAGLISLCDKVDSTAFPGDKGFKKITVNYEDHAYVICLSNKKVYVVKRKTSPQPPMETDLSSNIS